MIVGGLNILGLTVVLFVFIVTFILGCILLLIYKFSIMFYKAHRDANIKQSQ